MFIGIEDGIDGLIHVSDISWTKKVRHPNELYKVGDTVQAKVLTVDQKTKKFTPGRQAAGGRPLPCAQHPPCGLHGQGHCDQHHRLRPVCVG